MSDRRIIDRVQFQTAVTASDASLWENYQVGEEVCVAIQGTQRQAIQFFIELARVDADLATDLADVVRDVGVGTERIFWFSGYDLEEPFADVETYPLCPICGEPIDYCLGHPDAPVAGEVEY